MILNLTYIFYPFVLYGLSVNIQFMALFPYTPESPFLEGDSQNVKIIT